MAKYSVDSSDSPDGKSCELCGTPSDALEKVNISGAKISVCPDCGEHDDSQKEGKKEEESGQDNREVNSGERGTGYTINRTDSSWVENSRPKYDDNDTPYLVNNYQSKVSEAVSDLHLSEAARDANVKEEDLQSLIEGNAVSNSIGREAIEKVEDEFGIDIIEEF